MKPVMLCVSVDDTLIAGLAGKAGAVLGMELAVEHCRNAAGARECFRALSAAGADIPVVIADTSLPACEREELIGEIRSRSPWTGIILAPGSNARRHPRAHRDESDAGVSPQNLTTDLIRAVAAFKRAKENGAVCAERAPSEKAQRPSDVQPLRLMSTADLRKFDGDQAGLEELFRELNAETIQRLIIEQEAEKMSRRLTALQNNLKNNLFIRSVLHSVINMLQVQLSIEKDENLLIDDLERSLDGGPEESGRLLARLRELRKKTDDNLRKTMMGYLKAVQRSLLGERGYTVHHPTSLTHVLERIRVKYADILSGEKTRRPIKFNVEPPDREIKIWMFDFTLVNIIENLLTNSIRKVLEAERNERWITLSATEEWRGPDRYTILTWSDNGVGVPAERKQSIFEGDSDKTEEGDHGVGLPDVKATILSLGGFIREEGVPGAGAHFVIGIPVPAQGSE